MTATRPELSRTRAALLAQVERLAADRTEGWVLLEPREWPAARELERLGLVEIHGHDPRAGMFGALYARPPRPPKTTATKDAVEVVKASGRAILAAEEQHPVAKKKPADPESVDRASVILRLPRSLHARLVEGAARDGESLNTRMVRFLEAGETREDVRLETSKDGPRKDSGNS